MQPASFLQPVITRGRPLTLRAPAAPALLWRKPNLDDLRSSLVPAQFNFLINKALGRAGMIPGLPRLLLLVIFLVKLQSGGLGSQNTTMPGALCPASSSLLCFIGWSYPQIVL